MIDHSLRPWKTSHWATPGALAIGVLIGLGKLRAQNLYEGGYWDGRLWPSSPNVAAIAVDAAGDLIAAGNKLVFFNLTPVGGSGPGDIVRWDGQHWSILATNAPGVGALASRGGELFAGGQFASVDNVAATNVARWTGTNWTSMGDGLPVRPVRFATGTNAIYAASDVLAAGDSSYRLWAWDNSIWRSLGNGFAAPVKALLATNGALYAGWSSNLSRWDGQQWAQVATVMPNAAGMAEVRGIAMSGDTLVLAGAFGGVNGASATNVASLHGNNWTQLGTGLPDGDVRCLSRFGTNVYLCGAFKVLENGISTNAAILTLVSNQWV
ncbi:MAG TPA: hypothetical protein VGR78_09815, partial [Verrucomicrobiae bacterium]|nr:hypothetical protein [Verrucomicrobiae bacterium]